MSAFGSVAVILECKAGVRTHFWIEVERENGPAEVEGDAVAAELEAVLDHKSLLDALPGAVVLALHGTREGLDKKRVRSRLLQERRVGRDGLEREREVERLDVRERDRGRRERRGILFLLGPVRVAVRC